MTLIIDISYHQGVVNWPMLIVSGQVQGAIIRATEGWSIPGIPAGEDMFIDPQFRANWAGAAPLGWRGMYAYFRPNDERARTAAREQTVAQQVDRIVSLWLQYAEAGDFLVWDFEPTTADVAGLTRQQVADRLWWAMMQTEQRTGHPPVLYCNQTDWNTYLKPSGHNWNRFLIWFANPLSGHPQKTGYFSRPNLGTGMDPAQVAIWQYSWKGRIPGIGKDTDLNTPQAAFERLPARHVAAPPDQPEAPGTGDTRIDALVQLVAAQDRRITELELRVAGSEPGQPTAPTAPTVGGQPYRAVEKATLFELRGDKLHQVTGLPLNKGDRVGVAETKLWSTSSGQPRQLFGRLAAAPKKAQVGLWAPLKHIKPE